MVLAADESIHFLMQTDQRMNPYNDNEEDEENFSRNQQVEVFQEKRLRVNPAVVQMTILVTPNFQADLTTNRVNKPASSNIFCE
ncbi:hypothetical protein NPIL_14471 [Nephila pilipes]|uniref:Uncharacterized protein n=1 Tax=Nephila pilipes TaxID=299642 RepID=A0A8X6USK2_NEPPI|nr:hypothetical protein NPIL_14471 [Nephila pilipes]